MPRPGADPKADNPEDQHNTETITASPPPLHPILKVFPCLGEGVGGGGAQRPNNGYKTNSLYALAGLKKRGEAF